MRGGPAGAGAPRKLKWWEKGLDLPNVVAVEGTEGLLEAMALAGDRLVMVAFYATWCGACRMVHPKLLQLAGEQVNTVEGEQGRRGVHILQADVRVGEGHEAEIGREGGRS